MAPVCFPQSTFSVHGIKCTQAFSCNTAWLSKFLSGSADAWKKSNILNVSRLDQTISKRESPAVLNMV